MNAMDLRRGINMDVDAVVTNLKSRARMIDTSYVMGRVIGKERDGGGIGLKVIGENEKDRKSSSLRERKQGSSESLGSVGRWRGSPSPSHHNRRPHEFNRSGDFRRLAGGFNTAHVAARAYDRAAIKFRGVGAYINFNLNDYDDDLKQTKNLSKDESLQTLRLQINVFSRGSSKYRGVTLHKCGSWEARMGQFLGKNVTF